MNKLILGLDVSTTHTGVTILDQDNDIKLLKHIDFKNCKNLWEKADHAESWIKTNLSSFDIANIYIEDPAKKFANGSSSASVIMTCGKFNGLFSYVVRNQFKIDPEYIAPATARKLCGIKLLQRKKCGKPHKEQVFEFMMSSDLKHITWPVKTRSKKEPKPVVDWAKDIVDSYVVAKAGNKLLVDIR